MTRVSWLGLSLLFWAGVLLALGLATFSTPAPAALPLLFRLVLFGFAGFALLTGGIIFEAGRREREAEGWVGWLRDFQSQLRTLRYPLNADTVRPLAGMLGRFFPAQAGWVLFLKVPGVLVRGEVLRRQYLEILALDGPQRVTAKVESQLRTQLERDSESWQEPFLSYGPPRSVVWGWMRKSVDEDMGVAIAVALPAGTRRAFPSALAEGVWDTALDFLLQHLAILLADLVRNRERIGSEGMGFRMRALVHELARELQGAYTHLAHFADGRAVPPQAMAELSAALTRAAFWVYLFRDMPYFEDRWLPITPHPLDLGALLGQVLEDAHRAWPEHLFSLEMGQDWQVIADERLISVFRNLVYNAASFSPLETAVAVVVQPADSLISVKIEDGGPGVSAEQAERIFLPGVAFDRPRVTRGMGVGLSISREITRAYGGDLLCVPRSSTQPGGCFEVLLLRTEEQNE